MHSLRRHCPDQVKGYRRFDSRRLSREHPAPLCYAYLTSFGEKVKSSNADGFDTLQLRNVGLDYLDGGDTVHALRRINLTLSGTGLVLISGPTGSGKSTMLRVLAGREDPSRGEIALDGENTARWNETRRSAWRRRVGDASEELLLPDRTAAENAALSARMAGWRGADARRQASDALAALGLSDRSRALPGEMTARERKLTAIGCALARDPEILLLDEPFEGLDAITVQQVRELLTERASVRMVVAFSRDPMLFDGAEDTAAELEEGEIVSLRNEPEAGPPVPAPAPASAGPAMALASLFRPRGKAAVRLFGMFASVLAVCLGLACLQGAQRRASALQAETLAAYPLVLGKDSVTSGDLESLADMLILEELVQNYDVGAGSFYMAIDFSADSRYKKLTFLGPWDLSWGYIEPPDGGFYAGTFQNHIQGMDNSNPWFVLAMKLEGFRSIVRERWKALSGSGVLTETSAVDPVSIQPSSALRYACSFTTPL